MIGIITLNKPQGKTSHDMVYFIRRTFKTKQVGHTGTLDPMAEGVLPVLIGKATKLSDILTAENKEYIARIRLGVTTDTLDITGNIVSEQKVLAGEDEIKNVLFSFLGEQMQLPPMYSALKVDGKKLYTLARQGITVERTPRKINIFYIDFLSYFPEHHEFEIKVGCSKGTYIRSLCDDIGKALGCGAVLTALKRTKSGNFSIESSYTEEEVLKALDSGNLESLLTKIDDVLDDFTKAVAFGDNEKKVKNGIRLRPAQLGIKNFSLGETFKIYDENDSLICLSEVILENDTPVLKHLKSFY